MIGSWPPPRKAVGDDLAPVTITDVARKAEVSPATVSRVLNGSSPVSPELAQRVEAAAAKLGYRPFGPARALRQQRTRVWAAIVADIENPFFTAVVRGIEDVAQREGHRLVLCNSDEDVVKEAAYVDVAIAERMAGVVIAVASTAGSTLDELLDRQIPVVAIDRRPDAPRRRLGGHRQPLRRRPGHRAPARRRRRTGRRASPARPT